MVNNILKVNSKYPSLKENKNRIGRYLLMLSVVETKNAHPLGQFVGTLESIHLSNYCAIEPETLSHVWDGTNRTPT